MRLLVQDPLTHEALVWVDLESKSGEKIRTFGGWYRLDPVLVEGVRVGAVQVRRRDGRVDVSMTNDRSSAVLGSDWEWCFWDFVGRGITTVLRCEGGHESKVMGIRRGQQGWCLRCVDRKGPGPMGLVPFKVREYRLEA